VFSGTAVLLIIIAIFRSVYHLQEYITEKHFRYLGYIMLVMLFTYFYLAFTEYLTAGYKLESGDKQLLSLVLTGNNAPWFWMFVILGMVVPAFLLILSRRKAIPMVVIAAVLVVIGMWLKRFIIVVPTLEVPMMPFEFGSYSPSWVEVSIGFATLAGFALMITLAAKFLPLMSAWELQEQHEKEASRQEAGGTK
jgi:molybdopterin-containing oxidoreductase family membrane subunit